MNVYLNTNDLKFIEEQIFFYRYNIYDNKHIICGFWVFLKSNNEMCMFPCRLQLPVFIIILLLLSWWGKAFLTWRCFAYISGVYCLSCKQDHSSSSMIVTCIYRAWKTWVTMNQEMMNVVPVVLYNGVTDSLISSWSIRTQHCMHSMAVAPLTIVFNHLALDGQIDHRI